MATNKISQTKKDKQDRSVCETCGARTDASQVTTDLLEALRDWEEVITHDDLKDVPTSLEYAELLIATRNKANAAIAKATP